MQRLHFFAFSVWIWPYQTGNRERWEVEHAGRVPLHSVGSVGEGSNVLSHCLIPGNLQWLRFLVTAVSDTSLFKTIVRQVTVFLEKLSKVQCSWVEYTSNLTMCDLYYLHYFISSLLWPLRLFVMEINNFFHFIDFVVVFKSLLKIDSYFCLRSYFI